MQVSKQQEKPCCLKGWAKNTNLKRLTAFDAEMILQVRVTIQKVGIVFPHTYSFSMKYCNNSLNFPQFSNSKKDIFPVGELATIMKKDSVSKVAQISNFKRLTSSHLHFQLPSIGQPALDIRFSVCSRINHNLSSADLLEVGLHLTQKVVFSGSGALKGLSVLVSSVCNHCSTFCLLLANYNPQCSPQKDHSYITSAKRLDRWVDGSRKLPVLVTFSTATPAQTFF